MKRKIITFLIILVCFLLESTLFHELTFSSVKPNLLIIVTSAIGFMRGRKEGMAVGFISGLFFDVFWGNILGFYTLLFTIIGYINGVFQRMFYDEDVTLPIAMIGASELVYGITVYICFYMLKGDFSFGKYFSTIIIPELVYTIIITLGLYQIILHINRKLEAEEQRSASKFV